MAVYTHVSDADFEEILTHYSLGDFVAATGITGGVENTNYFLTTSTGRFIATIYEKRVNPKELPFFLNLMNELHHKGVSCPDVIAKKDSTYLHRFADKPFAITRFLSGKSVSSITQTQCRKLGVALAEFHQAAQTFQMQRPNTMSLPAWQEMWASLKDDAHKWKPGAENEISALLESIKTRWPTDLPTGIIHADLFPDNVFFLEGEVSGIIDFYFACNDFLAYDIAICLNAWCFEHETEFNITRARHLLAGYQSIRPLSNNEKLALPTLCMGAGLRFLLTRLHDWLHQEKGALVKPKNPQEYLAKVQFHQHVKDMSEYGLS